MKQVITMCLALALMVGCASMFKNIDDYQPITNTVYELGTAAYIKEGNCVPKELMDVVVPLFIEVENSLDMGKINIATVKAKLLPLLDIMKKDPVMTVLIGSGIEVLLNYLNNMGIEKEPLTDHRLETVKAVLDLNLAGLQAACNVTDIYNAWCK